MNCIGIGAGVESMSTDHIPGGGFHGSNPRVSYHNECINLLNKKSFVMIL